MIITLKKRKRERKKKREGKRGENVQDKKRRDFHGSIPKNLPLADMLCLRIGFKIYSHRARKILPMTSV